MRNNKIQDTDRYSSNDAALNEYERADSYSAVPAVGNRQSYHSPGEEGVCSNRGKGPKSYKRSDVRIFEDICRRMTENQYLDASDIDVSVQDGDVVLTGSVDGRYEKRLAADLGETAYGVRNVENRLKIRGNSR